MSKQNNIIMVGSMEYIVISMLTILFFTYIVSIIAHKVLAIPIHIKSLVLCACCALLISLILPRMFVGFAGLSGTLGILIVFAMISSYFIAYYYDGVMQKVALEKNTTAEPVAFSLSEIVQANKDNDNEECLLPAAELPKIPEMASLESISKVPEEVEEIAVVATDVTTNSMCYPVKCESQDEPEDHSAIFLEFLEKTTSLKNILEDIVPIATESPDVVLITEPPESVEKKYYYPMKCEESSKTITIEGTETTQSIDEAETNLQIPLLVVEFTEETLDLQTAEDLSVACETALSVNDNTPIIPEQINEFTTTAEVEVSADKPDNTPVPDSEDSSESSTDLDVLMDFAFVYKEQRNFLQALKVFRQALRLYPDSEVAPFLIVEIGTILKNLGSYDEAIQIFVEGRNLPGIINNSILEQQFINNIAYLRVVKNILIEDSLEIMPFNLIPESTFKKIDAEFCEWRNNQS